MGNILKSVRLVKKIFALQKAFHKASPALRVELAVWRRIGARLWAEIERKAGDADGLTLEEMLELLTDFLDQDLPALIGPPREPQPPGIGDSRG